LSSNPIRIQGTSLLEFVEKSYNAPVKNFLYENIYKYIKTYINIYNYIQNMSVYVHIFFFLL